MRSAVPQRRALEAGSEGRRAAAPRRCAVPRTLGAHGPFRAEGARSARTACGRCSFVAALIAG
jgi:hypothetical protein